MVNITKKFLAQELRRKGWSISEIARKLKMHKSGSISKWCRDISLTSEQIERLAKKQESGSYKGRMIASEKLRKARMREVKLLRNEGLKEIGKLNKRDLFIAGVGIYWSEGETYPGSDRVSFINSDPKMILLMLRWFRDICKVSDDKFSLQVKINKIHQKRVKEVEDYWSKLTKIPLDQFNKTILIESQNKKIYPNFNEHYGTLRVVVRQGTQLRRKINGWIEGLTKGIKYKFSPV
jgi:transcriptional regulator with XRE-family HTH domain